MAGNSVPPTLPRVRTYARDLEAERQRRAGSSATLSDSSSTPTPPPSPSLVPEPTPVTRAPVNQPKPLPPSNEATSTPLFTNKKPTPGEAFIHTGPTLTESVAAVVSGGSKQRETVPPATPNVIPSFHELTKPRPLAAAAKTGNTPVAADYGATIITDTKSDRFRFLPSLFSSIGRWWAAREKKRAAARAPKYVIPETDRRKGVIQRATSQTAKEATGDYEGLRQRLKERVEATVAEAEPTQDEPETIWTPHIEPIFPLLNAPQYTESSVQNVTLTPKRRSVNDGDYAETLQPVVGEDDERWAEAAVAYTAPAAIEVPEVAPSPRPEVFTPPPVVAPATPAPTIQSAPVIKPAPEPVYVEEIEEEADEDAPLPAPPQPAPSTNPKRRPEPVAAPHQYLFHTNTITISIVGVVVLVSLVVYLTPYILSLTSREIVEPASETSSTIAAPIIQRNLPELQREALVTALNISEEERTLPAVEVQLRTGSNSSAIEILQTLVPSLPPSAAQNVSNFSFGWYEKTEPFIILTISDRTSVWGGLLQHEARLTPALAPLFPTTSDGARFVDRVVAGQDVRTAIDPTKKEILTYGFIDDHTLIITTTNDAFLSIETLVTTVR